MQRDISSKKQLHYGWVIFGCCFVMVMVALGFCSSPFSLYLPVVTEQLEIPRSIFSLTNSFRYIVVAVMNLLFGALVKKISPRLMTAFGFIALIASLLIYSAATNVVVFYVGGCFLGLGLAWTTTTMVGYFVEKWFTKSKGTIMGVILAANGIGAAISSQLLTPLIYSSDKNGWRISYRYTALLLFVVGAVVVFLLRDDPKDKNLEPMGKDAVAKAKRGSKWAGLSSKEAFSKPYTYFALFFVFLCGLALQGCTGPSSAHMKDVGFDPSVIANAVSTHSLLLAAAKMLTGISYDKLGLRVTMLICNTFSVGTFIILWFMDTSRPFLPYLYSFFSAFGLPLETVMLPLIASDLFGQKDFSKLMGIFVSVNTMGYFFGTPLINLFFDKLGTYRSGYLFSIFVMLVAAVGMQFVITAAHNQRAAIESVINSEEE
ncbi:MAG: MFS transporter [Clostridia bacterium]|nr:MFS transporter [Clostridia bacterium]